ncbi:MAG: hypothetical protein KGL39_45930 [Patescibacteria group bacterium]|nr:hypothetical protein [Patescibacteria group bacterium]
MVKKHLPNDGTHGEVPPLEVAAGDHAAHEVLRCTCPYCGGHLDIGHALAIAGGLAASRVRLSRGECGVF